MEVGGGDDRNKPNWNMMFDTGDVFVINQSAIQAAAL